MYFYKKNVPTGTTQRHEITHPTKLGQLQLETRTSPAPHRPQFFTSGTTRSRAPAAGRPAQPTPAPRRTDQGILLHGPAPGQGHLRRAPEQGDPEQLQEELLQRQLGGAERSDARDRRRRNQLGQGGGGRRKARRPDVEGQLGVGRVHHQHVHRPAPPQRKVGQRREEI